VKAVDFKFTYLFFSCTFSNHWYTLKRRLEAGEVEQVGCKEQLLGKYSEGSLIKVQQLQLIVAVIIHIHFLYVTIRYTSTDTEGLIMVIL